MQGAAFRAQFQHVAEHGDAAAARADRRLAEHRQRRRHRRRIGIVAVVDDQRRTRRASSIAIGAPRPATGASLGQRQRRERKIGADQFGRRQNRERIDDEMTARRADLVGEFGAEDLRLRRSSSADAARI